MTKIEEMLKGVKVEWKKLGEVKEIEVVTPPKKIKKQDYNSYGKYPIIDQGKEYIVGFTEDELLVFPINEYVIFGDHTESIKYANFSFAQGADGIKVMKSDCTYLSTKYLYYAILSFYKKTGKYMRHFSRLKDTEIPIPSLEIQEKIVETLDKFTNYVTELKAELKARERQYSFYRDKLLSEEYLMKISEQINTLQENNIIQFVKLEELVKIKHGRDWKSLGRGNIPVYGSGGEMGVFVDSFAYNKPTVLIPRKGSIENVFYVEKPFWNVDTIFYTEIDEKQIMPKYFYYFIQSYDISSLSTDSTRPSLTQSALNKIIIPLPELLIQDKVVEILDKFQELLSDTKGLLPQEIDQRQKQYEYYRDKLLTFDTECGNTHTSNL